MRVVVLGAGGRHKTEASIVRAVRSLGHACRLVNVVGCSRYVGPLSSRAARYHDDELRARLRLLTRHAILPADPRSVRVLKGRARAFWYFDPKPTARGAGRWAGWPAPCTSPLLAGGDTYRGAGIPGSASCPRASIPVRTLPRGRARRNTSATPRFVGSGQYRYRGRSAPSRRRGEARLQIRGPGWEAGTARPSGRRRCGARTAARRGSSAARRSRSAPAPTRRRTLDARLCLEPDVEDPRLRRILSRPLRSRTSSTSRRTAATARGIATPGMRRTTSALPGRARASGAASRRPDAHTRWRTTPMPIGVELLLADGRTT